MEQRTKIIFGVVAVLVIGTVVLGTQSGMFKGSFLEGGDDSGGPFLYNGSIVSAVVSPVSSLVASDVTSEVSSFVTSKGGTSKVISEVTSEVSTVVTSPVASPVPLSSRDARGIDSDDLEDLTGQVLRKIEKEEYKRNPARFTLSQEEMMEVIKLYDHRAPPSPMPKPRGR